MKDIPGTRPPRIGELVRARDRLSFIYLERATVHRDANAITSTDERGVVHIPAAAIGALLLGPGTRVTHQAMMLLAESGSTVVWVGERGVRYYAHGRSLARSSRLLEAQAAAVSNQTSRLRIARQMYEMRFPGEDVAGLTMQQLRGREGARAIPAAFDAAAMIAAEGGDDIGGVTRRAVRDAVHEGNLLARCCSDIYTLLLPAHDGDAEEWDSDVVELWDRKGNLAAGISYADEDPPW